MLRYFDLSRDRCLICLFMNLDQGFVEINNGKLGCHVFLCHIPYTPTLQPYLEKDNFLQYFSKFCGVKSLILWPNPGEDLVFCFVVYNNFLFFIFPAISEFPKKQKGTLCDFCKIYLGEFSQCRRRDSNFFSLQFATCSNLAHF